MHIFAGIAVVPHVLTTVIAVGKQAALERVLSVQLAGTMILAKPALVSLVPAVLDAQCSYLCAVLKCLVPALPVCCVHVRYVYHSESVLRNAAD